MVAWSITAGSGNLRAGPRRPGPSRLRPSRPARRPSPRPRPGRPRPRPRRRPGRSSTIRPGLGPRLSLGPGLRLARALRTLAARLAVGGRGRGCSPLAVRPAVGPVEARPLEHNSDWREHLAQPAAARAAYRQRVVAETLHDLKLVSALGAGVLVRRHGPSKQSVSTRSSQLLNRSNG